VEAVDLPVDMAVSDEDPEEGLLLTYDLLEIGTAHRMEK
jgi:hypothetical protein